MLVYIYPKTLDSYKNDAKIFSFQLVMTAIAIQKYNLKSYVNSNCLVRPSKSFAERQAMVQEERDKAGTLACPPYFCSPFIFFLLCNCFVDVCLSKLLFFFVSSYLHILISLSPPPPL